MNIVSYIEYDNSNVRISTLLSAFKHVQSSYLATTVKVPVTGLCIAIYGLRADVTCPLSVHDNSSVRIITILHYWVKLSDQDLHLTVPALNTGSVVPHMD